MSDKVQSCETPGRPFIVASNDQWLLGHVFQPRCGRWDCPFCAAMNVLDWAWIAHHGALKLAENAIPLRFVTITSRGYVSNTRSIIIFRSAWPRLIRRVTYKNQAKPEYFLVPEHHKSGKLHAHFLITADFSQHWWHDNAFEAGLGYQAKTKSVYGPIQAGTYIVKELTKQLAGRRWPIGFRRIRLSRSWPRPPEVEKWPGWEFEVCRDEGSKNWQVAYLRDMGFSVRDIGDRVPD